MNIEQWVTVLCPTWQSNFDCDKVRVLLSPYPNEFLSRTNNSTVNGALFDFILNSNKKTLTKQVTINLICTSFRTKAYLPAKFILWRVSPEDVTFSLYYLMNLHEVGLYLCDTVCWRGSNRRRWRQVILEMFFTADLWFINGETKPSKHTHTHTFISPFSGTTRVS